MSGKTKKSSLEVNGDVLVGGGGGGSRRIIREGALLSLLCVVGKRSHALSHQGGGNSECDDSYGENHSIATFVDEEDRDHVEMLVNADEASVLTTKIDPDRIRWQTTWMLTEKKRVQKGATELPPTRQPSPRVLSCKKVESRHDDSSCEEDDRRGKRNKKTIPPPPPPPPPCEMVRVNSIMQDSSSSSSCNDKNANNEEENKNPPPAPPRSGDKDIPRQISVMTKSPKIIKTTAPGLSSGVTWIKTILKSSNNSNLNDDHDAIQEKPRRVVTWRLPSRTGSSIVPSMRTDSTSQFSSEFSDSLYAYDIDDEWEEALQASLMDCHGLLCDEDF